MHLDMCCCLSVYTTERVDEDSRISVWSKKITWTCGAIAIPHHITPHRGGVGRESVGGGKGGVGGWGRERIRESELGGVSTTKREDHARVSRCALCNGGRKGRGRATVWLLRRKRMACVVRSHFLT